MTDLPFGLESKSTFAALSPMDLQSLGKRASAAYLTSGMSLNDAIIKLAREYPSISPHQVQRVVEFANQETFAKLFSDNEKYASDKNIEFDVADPGVVLMELNNGARPAVMSAPPDEYSSGPLKLAHSNVEADLELTRLFLGVDPALPGSEATVLTKVAEDGTITVIDRVLHTKKANANGDIFDRVMSVGKVKHANLVSGVATQPSMAAAQAPAPEQAQAGAPLGGEDNGATHNEQMLGLQREIELAKKRQELQKVEQQTMDAMNPQGQPGAVPAPAPGMPGQGPDAGAAAAPADQAAGPVEAAPMPPEEAIPPPAAGAIATPPGSEPIKMGSLVKQAMAHVKSGRPHADLLLKAAQASVSLDAIKKVASGRSDYPMANPYGEVIRSKQKLAKLLEDCTYARGKNSELHKEATVRFQKTVAAHLWEGGNLGEVAHLMSAVHGEPVSIKTAMTSAMEELTRQGIDIVKAKAAAIQYEMEKSASARTPNLKHPIAEAYSDLHKIAEASHLIDETWRQLKQRYDVVDKALQEAMVHATAC